MNRYTIGGIAFTIAEPLPGLAIDGFSDIDVRVRFVQEDMIADSHTLRRVTGPGGLTGMIDRDAKTCWLADVYDDPVERSWQLRQMAPIFSSLLSRLVLHASAIETEAGVVGFIGESGAGKSTLARFLSGRGHRFVGDDLLPVRFTPVASAPVDEHLRPIAALTFLDRAPIDETIVTSLGAVDALRLLVGNGFGEHGDDEAWAFQFDAYHRLVESVPHFSMTIPDDLRALGDVADVVAGLPHRVR